MKEPDLAKAVQMIVAPADLVDRLTVLLLKLAHGLKVRDETIAYVDAMESEHWWASPGMAVLFVDLLIVNARIWGLESELRRGLEAQVGFEELGHRAIRIRDLNARRVHLKNLITEFSKAGTVEVKTDHLSAHDAEV